MEEQLQITYKMIIKLFKMIFHQIHQHLLLTEIKRKPKKEIETCQRPKLLNQHHKTSNQMQTEQ
jgi:hypothetical protein